MDGRGARLRTGKCLDLLADYLDAAVVTGVELEYHLPHVLVAVYPSCQREDGGCLARSGRPVEEEMG